MKPLLAALLLACACVGCGGGSASSGPAPASASSLASQIDSPANVAGQDSIDMASFWDKLVLSGYKRTGTLSGYWNKEFSAVPVRLSSIGVDASGQTRLRVDHLSHGARLGDTVLISGWASDVAGLKKEDLLKRLRITPLTLDAYEVLVDGLASSAFSRDLVLTLSYRYSECNGTQQVTQGKPLKDETYPNGTPVAPTYFNFVKASRVEVEVITRLLGCSPPETKLQTTRYFPYDPSPSGGANYPLLGQSVAGGDYSVVESFTLPSTVLKANDAGPVATIANYANSTRLNRTGKTLMRYEILSHTSNSVFVSIVSENYDPSNNLLTQTTDYYGKESSTLGDPYSLIRTVIKYMNPRKTEMVIDYSGSP